MDSYFNNVSYLAKKALIHEVLLSPKPGLVDRLNSGAHKDMDIYTFMGSVLSMEMYFYDCAEKGYSYQGDNYFEILDKIRPIGIKAEERMFNRTNGVNTHKGAIFIFGILCSSIGSLKRDKDNFSIEEILKRSSEISKNILDDFKLLKEKEVYSYGENQFLKLGKLGVRGEAKNGFPSIKKAYLVFSKTLEDGYSEDIALGECLLELMENVVDTNIIGRKGIEGLEYLKSRTKIIKDSGGYKTSEGIKTIIDIDKEFIKHHVSPGGCADLAAATLFLHWVLECQLSCKQEN